MKQLGQLKSMVTAAGSGVAILCVLLTLSMPVVAHDDNMTTGSAWIVERAPIVSVQHRWHHRDVHTGVRSAWVNSTLVNSNQVKVVDADRIYAPHIEVKTLSWIAPANAHPVAFSQAPALGGSESAYGHHQVIGNVVIKHRPGGVTVTGWHARLVDTQGSGQWQRVLQQEVRITLPSSAASGGWDVRSLERELERLGVKVKPKPTVPRPTPQLSG